jgi:hypothetical protein
MARTAASVAGNEYPEELKGVLERAAAGDASALPALRVAFDDHPELAAWLGDLAEHATRALLDLAAQGCVVAREALGREAAALRGRLRSEARTELERLLADRVAVCWVAAHQADLDLAGRLQGGSGAGPAARAAQRRADSASRRLLSAAKTFATVQKLLRPAEPAKAIQAIKPEVHQPNDRAGAMPAEAGRHVRRRTRARSGIRVRPGLPVGN